MSAPTVNRPVFNCPEWCGTHLVDRDVCDPKGGYVVHSSRPHITLTSDGGSDPVGCQVTVGVELATRLFTGEICEDFALPGVPAFVVLDAEANRVLTPTQAREIAAGLIAAAEVVEAQP